VSFETDWLPLLTWTVSVRNRTGTTDGFGNVIWTTARTSRAHVDAVVAGHPQGSGREGTAKVGPVTGTIYLPPQTLAPDDEITFPDGQVVSVSQVTHHYDDDGAAHHLEATWEVT